MTVPIRLLLSLALACAVGLAHAAGEPEFALTIRDHKFSPAELRIPAKTKVKLVVDNQDATPEEFDSHALNREKVIAGKSKATIFIGPLAPGRYSFMGEFHADTAQGVVVAQ
ncbi:MAG TPA: cupredoxin domain-containing protein [Casimicrobiaceae bacterium]|nr:cupredoxin domain-containing protein [Casimicrobiaceae bacterium]